MTKVPMYLALSIFMTMLPALVTARSFLTRDYVASKYDEKVVQYLLKYGHLQPKPDARELRLSHEHRTTEMYSTEPLAAQPTSHSNDEISNGIKSLQNSFGLKRSGKLDEDTVKLINTPRCEMSDKEINPFGMKINHNRVRRYATGKFKWNKKKLTWKIDLFNSPSISSVATKERTLAKAFQQWEYVSDFSFVKTSGNFEDIRIIFAKYRHNVAKGIACKKRFDGPYGAIAHAFLPYNFHPIGGDIHFDDSEKWDETYDLLSVAVHEIGHSLGLLHSSVRKSAMFDMYMIKRSLHYDDVMGVEYLYGPCQNIKIDAVSYDWGQVHFFRKDMVWVVNELNNNKLVQGYPKKIKDEFIPVIPNDVDVTVAWTDTLLYFLKGDTSYSYRKSERKLIYHKTIAYDWNGIPNNLDAGVHYSDDELTWFFKGNLTWQLDLLTVEPGYPKQISEEWPGLPNNLDAAYFSVSTQQTYFFKGNKYWIVDYSKDSQGVMNKNAYPGGLISQNWIGVCTE